MKVLVVGDKGAGGHARYCKTLVDSLQRVAVDASLHGKELFPTPWYTRFRPFWAADRLARISWNSGNAIRRILGAAPDLVHYQVAVPLVDWWWMPLMARRFPSVLTVHNVVPHDRSPEMHPALATPILRSMHAVIVHTEANREALLKIHPGIASRVHVVSHGAWVPEGTRTREDSRRALGIPDDVPVVLFFGRVRRVKGLDLLLAAAARIKEQGRHVKVLIAGEMPVGETFDHYAAVIRELGIADLVDARVGFIPDAEVATYYAAADLVALPYAPEFQAQSGVLLDAYGHGVPVVATNVGSLAETLRADETGLVVSHEPSGFDLASAILRLVDDPPLRRTMARRMADRASGPISWDSVARATVNVYQAAITRHAAASQRS